VTRPFLLLSACGLALGLSSAGASAQVYGSFTQSCTQIEVQGPYVRALCRTRGQYVPTRIDTRTCRRGGLANLRGQLVCEGGERRGYDRWEDDGPPQRRPDYDYGPRRY
jgi:hypothetical protein